MLCIQIKSSVLIFKMVHRLPHFHNVMKHSHLKCTHGLPIGLHTGTRVPIGTDTHFEKNRYLPVSLRTGTKWHRFVFEYRFVSTD